MCDRSHLLYFVDFLNICDSLVIKVNASLESSAQPILAVQFLRHIFFLLLLTKTYKTYNILEKTKGYMTYG